MTRSFVALCLVMLVLGFDPAAAGPANREQQMRVLVMRTGLEPACVNLAEVAAALARHPGTSAQVAVTPVTHRSRVVLFLDGDPVRVNITLHVDAHDLKHVLEHTPCGSIPDAVAAFVAAALVPLPPMVPIASWSADELVSAVRAELGDTLDSDLRLVISASDGEWEATLIAASCSQRTRIGILPAERHAAVRVAADAVVSMSSERDGCARRHVSMRSERALLLSEALQPYTRRRHIAGVIAGGGVVAALVGMALWLDKPGVGNNLMIAGGALAVGSSIVTIARPGSAAATSVGLVGSAFGVGVMFVGLACSPVTDELGQPRAGFRETTALYGAGFLASAFWIAFDSLDEPPIAPSVLWEARARLRTPRLRARVTDAELAHHEQAFRRSQFRMRYLVPPLVAGLAAFAYAAQLDDPEDREFALLLAGGDLAILGIALLPDPVSRYTRKLRKAGLDLQLAPVRAGAGVSVSGRF